MAQLGKRQRRRKKRRRLIKLALFAVCLIMLVRGFEKQVSEFSRTYFPTFARQVTAKAVTEAVEEVLADGGYTYADFASVTYSDGSVSAVETNADSINLFKNRIVAAAEKKAETIHNSKMEIPLGAFTGLTLIANHGPKIPLTYCLTGSFSAELVSTFEAAGINQTVHHIKLVVTATVVTASVDYKEPLSFQTDYEVAQSVILGDIPTTYGGFYPTVRS